MTRSYFNTVWLVGISIFSMFFGAGNVIFPLKIGLLSGDQVFFAMSGLFLTAIGGPILGLVGATFYKGRCLDFFIRPGEVIGLTFIATSLFLLGPFAVIPRCFIVAYASISDLFPELSLTTFSIIFGLISFFCAIKQSFILPILGKIFSPLLILSLSCIIIFGISTGSPLLNSNLSPTVAFKMGLQEGFNTMDLIAAIFFSSSIWTLLLLKTGQKNENQIAKTAITSGLIGGFLLSIVYMGLGLATAYHAKELYNCHPENLMSKLATISLGPLWGNIANVAIALACFTTVISLTQTIASLCHREFFPNLFTYKQFLKSIILVAIVFTNLGFSTISAFIAPIIGVCYPAIITLTICNILYKQYDIKTVKTPVYGILIISTILKYLEGVDKFIF